MEITAPALGGAGAGAGTVSLTKSTTEKVANVASSKGIDFVAIEKDRSEVGPQKVQKLQRMTGRSG